jgi:hypothetical protein
VPSPFDSYFAAHIAPGLAGAPPPAVQMCRAAAADIWNAAIDAADTQVLAQIKSGSVAICVDDLKVAPFRSHGMGTGNQGS